MKKLIGMSLIALFAIVGNNSASAQVYTSGGTTTIVKHKSDGKQKVKVVPNPPPAVVYPAPYRRVEMYHQAPYYGYRKVKYYDGYGGGSRKVIYDEPYHHHHGHYNHYDHYDHYHYHYH